MPERSRCGPTEQAVAKIYTRHRQCRYEYAVVRVLRLSRSGTANPRFAKPLAPHDAIRISDIGSKIALIIWGRWGGVTELELLPLYSAPGWQRSPVAETNFVANLQGEG